MSRLRPVIIVIVLGALITPPTWAEEQAPGPETPPSIGTEELGPPVPLDKPGVVTISVKDASLNVILEQVVLYGNYDLVSPSLDRPVTAYLSGTSIRQALDALIEATGNEFKYVVKGHVIVIVDTRPPSPEAGASALLPSPGLTSEAAEEGAR